MRTKKGIPRRRNTLEGVEKVISLLSESPRTKKALWEETGFTLESIKAYLDFLERVGMARRVGYWKPENFRGGNIAALYTAQRAAA